MSVVHDESVVYDRTKDGRASRPRIHPTKVDRGEKFEHYKEIPSLREYVLVSHLLYEEERAVEVRRREANGAWSTMIARAGRKAILHSIACTVDVDALYAAAMDPGV